MSEDNNHPAADGHRWHPGTVRCEPVNYNKASAGCWRWARSLSSAAGGRHEADGPEGLQAGIAAGALHQCRAHLRRGSGTDFGSDSRRLVIEEQGAAARWRQRKSCSALTSGIARSARRVAWPRRAAWQRSHERMDVSVSLHAGLRTGSDRHRLGRSRCRPAIHVFHRRLDRRMKP